MSTLDWEENRSDGFLELMRRRYACKRFKRDLPLSDKAAALILECGRLSPSSFGLEPWKFVAVRGAQRIRGLGDACFGQEAVYSCALAIVILVRTESAYIEGSEFLRQRASRFPGGYPVFIEDYRGYHAFLEKEGRVMAWARAQAYIPCANMMSGAASAGLDSCAIEGYDEAALLSQLDEDGAEWAMGLMAVFGMADEAPRSKIREPLSAISRIL